MLALLQSRTTRSCHDENPCFRQHACAPVGVRLCCQRHRGSSGQLFVGALPRPRQEKKRPFIVVGSGTPALTNEQCTPYTVHYASDTVALARGTGSAVVKAGGKSWYFLTADYTFGQALQNDTANIVKTAGGTVLGASRVPLSASDFSSFLRLR